MEARWRDDGVLVVTMRGRQDGDSIETLLELCRERFRERAPRAVLFDATAVDGFSTDLRQPAVELLKPVRSSGLTRASPRWRRVGSG